MEAIQSPIIIESAKLRHGGGFFGILRLKSKKVTISKMSIAIANETWLNDISVCLETASKETYAN